jgi:hypothetical protein
MTNYVMLLLAIAGGVVSGLSIPAGILYFLRRLLFLRPHFKSHGRLRNFYVVTVNLVKTIGIILALLIVGELPAVLVVAFSGKTPAESDSYMIYWAFTTSITLSIVVVGSLIFLLGRWLLRRRLFRSEIGQRVGR